MLTSPLAVHPETEEYWTAHDTDCDFGAQLDGYKNTWSGSVLATPPFEDAQLLKATTWALDAARQTAPSLTLLLVPRWCTKKFHKTLRASPKAHCLTTIPHGSLRFSRPYYRPDAKKSRTKASWDTDIWVIANSAGLHRFYDKQQLPSSLQQALSTNGCNLELTINPPPTCSCQRHGTTAYTTSTRAWDKPCSPTYIQAPLAPPRHTTPGRRLAPLNRARHGVHRQH